ncbi:MAG: hypothetical protein Q9187_009011 [Circinaria calcarea]
MSAVFEMMEDELDEAECELRFLVPQDIYRRYLELGSVDFRAEVEQRDADRIAAAQAEEERRIEVLSTAVEVGIDLAGAGFPRSQMVHVDSTPGPTFAEQSELIRAYLSERILEIQGDERFSDLIRGFVLTTCPVLLMDLEQLTQVGTALQTLADEIAASSDNEQIRQEELEAALPGSPTPSHANSPPQREGGSWDSAEVEASRQRAIRVIELVMTAQNEVRRWVVATETWLGRPLREMSAEEVQELQVDLLAYVLRDDRIVS